MSILIWWLQYPCSKVLIHFQILLLLKKGEKEELWLSCLWIVAGVLLSYNYCNMLHCLRVTGKCEQQKTWKEIVQLLERSFYHVFFTISFPTYYG